ncbi:MAG: hypothetical protein J0M37_05890 [Ignavibacteria bacterium]|nr:hypothetical protein [Ignavibacteria bacterium]
MNSNFEHYSAFYRGTVLLFGFFLRKITVFLFLIALIYQPVTAQNSAGSNLEIFEQEISGELEKFFYYPEINRDVKFVYWVSSASKNKEEKKFLESTLKKLSEKNKIKYSIAKDENMLSPDSSYYRFTVDVIKLQTDYTKFIKNKFLGSKSMERLITSKLSVKIKSSADVMILSDEVNTSFSGEIPYDNYTQYESAEYKFTQSTPPDISFLESIIFPAAVITLSAVAAVLFFTIRSK